MPRRSAGTHSLTRKRSELRATDGPDATTFSGHSRSATDRRKLLTGTDVLACRAGWTIPDLPSRSCGFHSLRHFVVKAQLDQAVGDPHPGPGQGVNSDQGTGRYRLV